MSLLVWEGELDGESDCCDEGVVKGFNDALTVGSHVGSTEGDNDGTSDG